MKQTCSKCKGTGQVLGKCAMCKGGGTSNTGNTCQGCGGTGKTYHFCSACNGAGEVEVPKPGEHWTGEMDDVQ